MTDTELTLEIAQKFQALKKRMVALEIELDTHYQDGEPMPWRDLVDSSLAVPVNGDVQHAELRALARAIDPSSGTAMSPLLALHHMVCR